MTQPLAVLNDEEMHWLNDLGLPNQRRWLNHRNSVTNTAERFPPPGRILAYQLQKDTKVTKDKCKSIPICFVIFMPFCGSTKGEFASAALLMFDGRSHFQQTIEHFRTLCTACGELRVCLLVHVLQSVELICDVQRGEDRYF
jgi:hypothetical protein